MSGDRVSGAFSDAEIDYLERSWKTMTPSQMAAELGRSPPSVRNKCSAMGYVRGTAWTTEEVCSLVSAYSAMPVNLAALSEQIGRHKTNISRKARSMGLTDIKRQKLPPELKKPAKIRKSEAQLSSERSQRAKDQIARNGHPRGALGMRHTDEAKAVLSRKASARWGAMTQEARDNLVFSRVKAKRDAGIPFSSGRGNWKAGWREVGGQRCFFRSRWEANYARYLEWLRSKGELVSWEHEAKTFWFEGIKRGVVSYLPDFKVLTNGGLVEWHEVKGWMDARSKTTIARMGRYHPNERLILIQQKQYDEIRRKLSTMIAGWES